MCQRKRKYRTVKQGQESSVYNSLMPKIANSKNKMFFMVNDRGERTKEN